MHFIRTARENLIRLILEQPKSSIDDTEIRNRGYNWTIWQDFKRANVVGLLKNTDHRYLIKGNARLTKRSLQSRRPQTCQSYRRIHQPHSPKRSKSVPVTFRPTQEFPLIDEQPYWTSGEPGEHDRFGSADETNSWNPNVFRSIAINDKVENNDIAVEELNNDGLFPALSITNKKLTKTRVESREFKEDWFRHSKLLALHGESEDSSRPTDKPEVNEEILYIKSPIEIRPQYNMPNNITEPDLDTESRYSDAIYKAYENSKQDIYISKFRMNCLRKILQGREEKRKRAAISKYIKPSDTGKTLAEDIVNNV